MAQLVGADEIESLRIELAEIGRSLRSSFQRHASSFRSSSAISSAKDDFNDENKLQWAAIERLPTSERLRSSLFDQYDDESKPDAKGKRVIDVTELGALERHMFIEKLIKHIQHDNLRLLQNIRRRIDKVGVKLPSVEVRYKNLCVEAECMVVHGKPLPTLWNSFKGMFSGLANLSGLKSQEARITVINNASGIIKPGRLTLLLGPPGSGKTTFLLALSGNLKHSLKATGEVTYNGYKLEEFVPQKTSAYISQNDLHMAEMTVRETLDFSACCQGIGDRSEIMLEVSRREKQAGVIPDLDIDTYMKAISVEGLESTLQTDYVLKILGLDICADTMVGDTMRTGISGGQKKRLTTGEMIVGPTKALFMDEITNGLDSSTAFQIVSCLQQLAHISDATILVSLLQPAPETFDLFDDIILMSEGRTVFHGPRSLVLEFFEDCGFRCPERKGVTEFLQEVISKKDQANYWCRAEESYKFVSVDMFSKKFQESPCGKKLDEELSKPFDRSQSHKNALSFGMYSLSKWVLFKACMSREMLLMRRNAFIYVYKIIQLTIISSIMMTVFLRTRMAVDVVHASYYLGALFYALVMQLVDGFPELALTVARLPVFYKQRDLYFYPAWAYAIPATLLKVPFSLLEALIWTSLTYYVIGFSPEVQRFFRQFILLFAVHLTSSSIFRFLASAFRTIVAASSAGSFVILFVLLFGGFIIPQPSMPNWLKWAFWVSPLTYGEIGLAVNEFRAPRWQRYYSNSTVGEETLKSRGLNFDSYYFWISIAALFAMTIIFNIGFTLALTFLKPPGFSRGIISHEKLSQFQQGEDARDTSDVKEKVRNPYPKTIAAQNNGMMVLPFEPLTVTFQDVQYYIDTPVEMREHGYTQKNLQLLCDITGSFRPRVLTALMGVSGAGKTTLLDVLSGRKTSGTIKGEIRIGGFPKVQETFARISGYCEQTDIHSPNITVEESLMFSAWLRLPCEVDTKTKEEFVREVLETIELEGIKDALVGIPGISGLSTEQRKRLTIAVELVANPSIIFMDEPTTGLDARAAAIVMRAVKNVVQTGRTTVCTIHQPSIDIFEAFDELILLKTGGHMIYAGPLGQHSCRVIKYFEGISRVPKIKDNYNPATWMLEVTSTSAEAELGVDFAQIYKNSALYDRIFIKVTYMFIFPSLPTSTVNDLDEAIYPDQHKNWKIIIYGSTKASEKLIVYAFGYRNNKEVVKQFSTPPPDSRELHFSTRFSQSSWGQYKFCLWKQHLSYWRSPSYNLVRLIHTFVSSLVFGLLFWKQGQKLDNQQDIFIILGSMFSAAIFLGINNCSTALPHVANERTALYRERFAGMYSSWSYSLAQVTIEIPYTLVQALEYTIITYPMIGYYGSAYKIFWYFFAMFCTLLNFNYLGMLLVSITPNYQVASIISSAFYTMFYLFAGFIVPEPQIPRWWVWLYYLIPTSWTLNGMLTSQYGDIDRNIVVFGETKTMAAFLKDYFGFHHDRLALVGVMLIVFPLAFALLFSYCIGKLNFQRR